MTTQNKINQIHQCEVCNNSELTEVLNLGNHPMCDDLIEVNNSRVCKEYPIVILYCPICKTAHQKFQIPKIELFPKTYHYRSRFTSDVIEGIKLLSEECEKVVKDLTGKKVLDIGCNDGSLLDIFSGKGADTYGIEPTDAALDAIEKGHKVYQNYLTPEIANIFKDENGKPDIITFTNVFAHIENLNEVIDALKKLMSDETILVIENHYLGAVLEKNQFDTFYHEHPRTYSYQSFKHIAQFLGKEMLNVEFPSRYGGNIRVIIGNKRIWNFKPENLSVIEQRENGLLNEFKELRSFIDSYMKNKKAEILEYKNKYGKLKAKAFPGRAAILIKILDLDETIIEKVYEKPGSMKIGHYIPGTRIPIVSDDELFVNIGNEQVLLNLAWHINVEIKDYLEKIGFKGTIVDIL